MGKSKNKQSSRRQKREERKQHKQAEQEAQAKTLGRRRVQTVLAALATVGAAVAIKLSEGSSFALGMTLLVGLGLTLTLALGGLGGSVKPRDRAKSGNIDFGG